MGITVLWNAQKEVTLTGIQTADTQIYEQRERTKHSVTHHITINKDHLVENFADFSKYLQKERTFCSHLYLRYQHRGRLSRKTHIRTSEAEM